MNWKVNEDDNEMVTTQNDSRTEDRSVSVLREKFFTTVDRAIYLKNTSNQNFRKSGYDGFENSIQKERSFAIWAAEHKPAPRSHVPLESWFITPEGLLVACWCERFQGAPIPTGKRCCIVNEDERFSV
jgi:hypothetical protein